LETQKSLLTPGQGGASVCDTAAHVAEYGEVLIGTGKATAPGVYSHVRVAALVPNGVASLTITDRNGAVHSLAAKNNTIEDEDAQAATVTYRLPSGSTQATNVAGLLDRIPNQPAQPSTGG
jgi:hypothetical protein